MRYWLYFVSICLYFIACTNQQERSTHNRKQHNSIEALMAGNKHFVAKLAEDKQSHENFLRNQNGQNPQAVVITCSDSRIPPSLLFQKEIGDLFTIRTAGNIVGDLEMASIEYAVAHLHTPLILVMGHTHCGAISAFIHHENAPEHIKIIMDSLGKEKEIRNLLVSETPHQDSEFVVANVLHTAHNIPKQSELIRKEIEKGKLTVVAAVYDLETGRVSILE